jgi:glycerate 2-kinase
MIPVSDAALETLHTTATEIFTGALEACNIESAFDRRIRFEGHTMHRLLPDGSGPATIDLNCYKRVFVIALGKAAGPMLDTLLDRMKRRKGLRGICCSNQLPKSRNWRFRYFERGAGHAQEGAQRHADLLPHFRRRVSHVRPAPGPADHA